ncbi:MAG TPA: hypothetical protein VF715_07180 [Thermoleophilaceae bacterium]
MTTDGWRTFCHVSEYDEWGYRNLHRMIAGSDPLVLWAPSSQLLLHSPACRVGPDEFLEYVERGCVQVVAREDWIEKPRRRNAHPWDGAAWDQGIDGTLRAMCREDANEKDLLKRRVAIAPEATGPEAAKRHLADHPETVEELRADLESAARDDRIPPGTLQAARPGERSLEEAVEAILKDAFNHAEAIAYTRSESAILLAAQESAFLRYLIGAYARDRDPGAPGGPPTAQLRAYTNKEINEVLFELLERLEREGPVDLPRFMRSTGREALIEWTRGVAHRLHYEQPEDLRAELSDELRKTLEAGEFPPVLNNPTKLTLTGGLATGIAEAFTSPSLIGLTGLAFGVVEAAEWTLKQMGLKKREYTGDQWPFQYAYASGASIRKQKALLELFDV